MIETMTVAGVEDALDEIEASFLSCENSPAVHAALALLPPATLPAPGGRDERYLMRSARSTKSGGCCGS
jgi:hypothetical protein